MWGCDINALLVYKRYELSIHIGNCSYIWVSFTNIQATLIYWGLFLDIPITCWVNENRFLDQI